jgi:hypothetical protein
MMDNPECFSCGTSAPGGLKILGQYLCKECETKLVQCEIDKIDYQHWIDSCRRFWERSDVNLNEYEADA